jgi:glycosyltransferase involved in cell wall biosynthesis
VGELRAGPVTAVHVIVPDGIDDPMRPSGGNVYDRRICDGLAVAGWSVHEHPVAGQWPSAGAAARAGLAVVLGGLPDGELVLLDGLIASGVPEVIVPEDGRLRLVILLHMPLGAASPEAEAGERTVLSSVSSVVTTSQWTRQWLIDHYALPSGRLHIAEPGAEIADLAPGTPSGGELLCVGAVTPAKGHDVLVAALATVSDLRWRCVCVGATDTRFLDDLRTLAEASGIADRLRFTGPLTGGDLDKAYDSADVLVSASRAETYGMVVTEALAHGLPVIASKAGGVSEALGHANDATRPGLLVTPGDPQALATSLRTWLDDPGQRHRLRKAAHARRLTLSGWDRTTRQLSLALMEVAG